MTVCVRSKIDWRYGRAGFTLLEVLLTSVLMATLLAGVWSLFHVYTRLFETGQTRTEQAQLVRSLMRQLSDDLRSAIQDTATRPPQTPATAPLRRFGVFGTSRSLQLDIMRVPPMEDRYLQNDDSAFSTVAQADQDNAGRPKAPEFRTVQYTFQETSEMLGMAAYDEFPADEEQPQRAPGLTRRELDWEIPGGESGSPGQDPRLRPAVGRTDEVGYSGSLGADSLPDGSLDDSLLNDDAVMHVPEVVGLEFRYFDGRGWTSSWNSIQRKSLPAAVEVSIEIEPTGDRSQHAGDASAAANGVEVVEEQNPSDLSELTAESEAATHRVVVYLPISPLQRPPKKVGTVTQRIKAGVPNRAVEKLKARRQRLRERTETAPGPPADEYLRKQR